MKKTEQNVIELNVPNKDTKVVKIRPIPDDVYVFASYVTRVLNAVGVPYKNRLPRRLKD